jgi:trigger factor
MLVTITPAACQASYQKAVKEIRKEISLPGFRKGHVPEELVHKHFESQVDRRTQNIAVFTAFDEAVRLVGRQPFAKNSLRKSSVRKFSRESGAEILFEYEASPQVPPIEIDTLKIEAISPKLPTESDVEEFYTRLRFLYSEKKPVENHSIQDGDAIKVEIFGESAEPSKPTEFFVHHGLIPEWLYPSVIGMNKGETKEISFPATSAQEQPSSCSVKILDVFECHLPEENDTFATSVGATSIEDLKHKILMRLEYDAKNAVQEKMRRQVKNELIRLYAFDLPQSLVEGETEARFHPYWETVSKSAKTAPDKETLRKSFLEEVKRQFTCFFLFQPLFAKIKPSYTNAELMDELNYQASRVPVTQCVLHPKLKEEEIFDRLLSNIIMRQCEDFCIEQRLGIVRPILAIEETHENLEDVRECSCHEHEADCDCPSDECDCHRDPHSHECE